jgi:hypothetical protein
VVGGLCRGARPESMPAGQQTRAEEVHGEIFGKSREGLTTGPHAEVIQREEKRAADTWDREGAGVHLAVAHTQRERELAERARDAGQVGSGPLRRK